MFSELEEQSSACCHSFHSSDLFPHAILLLSQPKEKKLDLHKKVYTQGPKERESEKCFSLVPLLVWDSFKGRMNCEQDFRHFDFCCLMI